MLRPRVFRSPQPGLASAEVPLATAGDNNATLRPKIGAWIAFSYLCAIGGGSADENGCFELVSNSDRTSVWGTIGVYFRSLTDFSSTPSRQAWLIQLHNDIITYEQTKKKVIQIVQAHITGGTGGGGVNQVGIRLRMDGIPKLMSKADQLAGEIQDLVDSSDLFVAQPAFKDLKTYIDEKRASTLCELRKEEELVVKIRRKSPPHFQ